MGRPGGRNLPRLCCLHSPPGFPSPPDVRGWLLRAFGPGPNGLVSLVWERDVRPVTGCKSYKAAEVMGVTVDAIRKRISRDTIPHERDEDGRVWVVLDTDQDAASNQ